MTVDTYEQLAGLRAAGRVVRATIEALEAAAAPGVTTKELDDLAAEVMTVHGAQSGPILTYGYPGWTCLSVDEEIVHAIPGPRVLRAGQLLTLDVALELNGFYADAARTIAVGGSTDEEGERLIAAARSALAAGIAAARPGAEIRAIGAAVEAETNRCGFRIVRELQGHGIGRRMHEDPGVPNWPSPGATEVLTPGMVFTIEPMIVAGSPRLRPMPDGWTISAADGRRSSHEEHTIMIAEDGDPVILTA